MGSGSEPRVAGVADASTVAEIFARAFYDDPLWGWAFPDPQRRLAQHTVFWRFFVEGALRHDWVWLTPEDGAAALWIPPGCPEFSAAEEARVVPMLEDLLGPSQAEVVLEIFSAFEASHPQGEPHYYLSLLGTDPDHRGQGLGVGLVADNLERIDSERAPAYLESTNPANNARYERLGFTQIGEFRPPRDGPPIAMMWREARPGLLR